MNKIDPTGLAFKGMTTSGITYCYSDNCVKTAKAAWGHRNGGGGSGGVPVPDSAAGGVPATSSGQVVGDHIHVTGRPSVSYGVFSWGVLVTGGKYSSGSINSISSGGQSTAGTATGGGADQEWEEADSWNTFSDGGAGGGTEWLIYNSQSKIFGAIVYPNTGRP